MTHGARAGVTVQYGSPMTSIRPILPLCLAGLALATPAHALDVELGVDGDAAFAISNGEADALGGPGGGASLRLGLGPNATGLGPTGFAVLGEAVGSYWIFRDATAGDTSLLRLTGGARLILTPLWIRKPLSQGGRGRGIRLDIPVTVHVGGGRIDGSPSWTPTADASVGLAIGFLPVEVGVHVGAGVLADSPSSETGSAWMNGGVDVGLVF